MPTVVGISLTVKLFHIRFIQDYPAIELQIMCRTFPLLITPEHKFKRTAELLEILLISREAWSVDTMMNLKFPCIVPKCMNILNVHSSNSKISAETEPSQN